MYKSNHETHKPCINKIELTRSCKKLAHKAKVLYSSIFPKKVKNIDQDFALAISQSRGPGFLSVIPSKPVENPKTMSSASRRLSASPSKSNKSPNKRNLSPDEESQVDKIIQLRLSQQYETIKISMNKKFEKLHPQVFSQNINTIRADTLAKLQMTKLEKQLLPQLKREAVSEILLKRKSVMHKSRKEILSELSETITTKQTFEPIKLISTEGDIQKLCADAQKSLRRYSVKPFVLKIKN